MVKDRSEENTNDWHPNGLGKPCQCQALAYIYHEQNFDMNKCKYVSPSKETLILQSTNLTVPKDELFVAETVYKNSYIGTKSEVPKKIKPTVNLHLSDNKLDHNTTHQISYPSYSNVKPPSPIYPSKIDLCGKGPMEVLTTTRLDYGEKTFIKSQSMPNVGNLTLSDKPFEGDTTTKSSYPIYDLNLVKNKLYKPISVLHLNKGKMDNETINKLTYKPWSTREKRSTPWAEKQQYRKPHIKFSDDTMYKQSFPNYEQYKKRDLIIPNSNNNILTNSQHFYDDTVHKSSFRPVDLAKVEKIVPECNLGLNNKPMDVATINKLTYQPYANHKPPLPIKPNQKTTIEHKEQMEQVTAHKFDFTKKTIEKLKPFKTATNIVDNKPLEGNTTHRLAYIAYDFSEPPKPIHPVNSIFKETGKMDDITTHKISYIAWDNFDKMDIPWAKKETYNPPGEKFANKTITRLSYMPPGKYVCINNDCANGCFCEYPGQCLGIPKGSIPNFSKSFLV